MSEMRLQRALARAGIASRRAAEELIRAGRVRVDGKVAELGQQGGSGPAEDHRRRQGGRRWSPGAGSRSTSRWAWSPRRATKRAAAPCFEFIRDPAGLTYVGRLDVMTTGLLLLTTDGEAVHRLTHPKYRVPRRYTALVHGTLRRRAREAGARTGGGRWPPGASPQEVRVRPGKEGRCILDVTLTEGRNRIVRRWCEEMGLKVERLARLSYGPVRLGDLPVGRSRPLTPREEAAHLQDDSARPVRRLTGIARRTDHPPEEYA